MKYGYVKFEYYGGSQMHPGAFSLTNKIGLGISNKWRFVGYKTSILRFMLENSDATVATNASSGETIHVKIGEVMKSGSQQYIEAFQGAALGVAGEFVTAVEAMMTVVDGLSTAETVFGLPGGPGELKMPTKTQYYMDHALNSRIIVDLQGKQSTDRHGWHDTGVQDATLRQLAYLVHAS